MTNIRFVGHDGADLTLAKNPKRRHDHAALIARGLALYEARRYAAALPCFDRALRMAPECPIALYNRANTLHMLERSEEASEILKGLLAVTPEVLHQRCEVPFSARSIQTDACMLLFWTTLHHRGFCDEAFEHAAAHLRRRSRGVPSVWSKREVLGDIAAMMREWRGTA